MTFIQPRALTLAILAATFGLTACNSNDDDGSLPGAAVAMKTVTIVPSLGKISKARVVLRNARNLADNRGNLGDSLDLRADGSVSFQVPANAPELLAELQPTNQTTYFDEGVPDNPATVGVDESHPAFPLTQTLRVAFRLTELDAQGRVAMTPLTEAAVNRAKALAGAGSLAGTMDAANAFIKNVFKLASIHQVPVLIDNPADFRNQLMAASNVASREYAMRLAALARQARNANNADATPALSMMKALSDDVVQDDELDGMRQNSPIAGAPYDVTTFLAAWRAAMTQLVAFIRQADGLSQLQLDWLNGLSGGLQLDPKPPMGVAVPVRTVNGIAEYACADRNRVKSLNSNSRLDIDFVNQSGKTLKIDWLNNLGQAVNYKTGLANGATYAQASTYVTHPWLITDSAGQCQGIFVATTTTKKTITLNANGVATLAEAGNNNAGVPATINAGLIGNYTLVYQQSQAGGIYQHNQQITFSVGANGNLNINGMPLGNPYHQVLNNVTQTNEVNWDDGNARYALSSNNTGVFNEINVFDKSKVNPFMGQFVKLEENPGDPEQASCGSQQELTVQNLAAYVGTYNVAIKKNDPVTFENVTVKNTTLTVEANGKMTLDGQVANGIKYCANPNTVTNVTGLMVHLDKSDALGRSHIDFWPDKTVNGTDYTHAAAFRFFSGAKP